MPKPIVQILVCTNERSPNAPKPCCSARGAIQVYRDFKDTIRELGLRDEIMVVRTGCLKHCSRGTAVAVWPYNHWYAGVERGDVLEIVEAARPGRGDEIERLRMPDIPWE